MRLHLQVERGAFLQCCSQFGRRLPALCCLQFHRPQDCCLSLGRDGGYDSSRGDKPRLSCHLQRGLRRDSPRKHGIERCSQGVDVRPLSGAHSVLLWRSIARSHCSCAGKCGYGRIVNLGNAEVYQHRPTLGGDLYVSWLHITVDDRGALIMQILQGTKHLPNPGQSSLLRNWTPPLDH